MPIAISCKCGKHLQVKDELAGRNIRCPACQAILSTRKAADAPEVEQAPPSQRAAKARSAPPPQTNAGPPIQSRQIVLRWVVLVLAIAGSGIAGIFGFKAYSNTHDPEQIAIIERNREHIKDLEKGDSSNPVLTKARDEVSRFESNGRLCYLLLAAALLGLGGAVLAFMRRRIIAAPLLIVPAVGSGILAVQALVLTAPLILAGLLALMIRPVVAA